MSIVSDEETASLQGFRDKTKKKPELMDDLIPLLKKRANGREIMGLKAYE